MRKKITLTLALIIANIIIVNACTNFLVGKKASVDGSTLISYSADSYWLYGALYHYPAAKYPEGAKMDVYEWDTGKYLGQIAQARETYNVIGNMNEYQLAIGEATDTGREELIDTTGLIDYGSLIYSTLQRAKNAREAIYTMVKLVEEYGYYSSGESFSIADPNEIWIMEMIGKGPGSKGAVWVAQRIPDDCISAHANQARITTFAMESRKNKTSISSKNLKKIYNPEVTTVYAYDVIDFARSKGYFNGKNEEFSFSDTYNPLDFGGVRFCEARVWSFFNRFNKEIGAKYLSYIQCETKERMPLYIKADRLLSAQDIKDAMRDHYEGTPLDMTKGMGCGPYNSVYRMTPLTYKHKGVEYYHERPVGTQQTGFTFVAQMRSSLPNEIGGILWFGVDDATCNVYVPIYTCSTEVPKSMQEGNGTMLEFSWTSAFWVNNWVAQMVYNRYSELMPDLRKHQIELENAFTNQVKASDAKAMQLMKTNPSEVRPFLTQCSKLSAEKALTTWKKLGEYFMVKYLDGAIKGEQNGKFMQNDKHIPGKVLRPGYSKEYIEHELVNPNPERFRAKTAEEMNKRK